MSRYGTLDDFGNRIRNEGEIAVIKKDLDQYLRTENDDFILRYLSYYGSLRETLKQRKYSTRSFAVILWDIMHPLKGNDLKRWQKNIRRGIKDTGIIP